MSRLRKTWHISTSIPAEELQDCFLRAFFQPQKGLRQLQSGVQWTRTTHLDSYTGEEALAATVAASRGPARDQRGATIAFAIDDEGSAGSYGRMALVNATTQYGLVAGGSHLQRFMKQTVDYVLEKDPGATIKLD